MPALSDYVSGTITLTNGSNGFTGTGTGWQAADFREGDTILGIEDHAGVEYVIATIDGNGSGTLTQDWEGATGTYTYRMRYLSDGARVTAQARNLIELLGNGNIQALAGLTGPGVPVFNGPHSMTVKPETDFVNGVAYNVQVDTLADRAAYDGQSAGFSVLVSDVGDGRSAVYSKASNTSGDWSDPAYVTGPVGPASDISVGDVTTLPPGSDATVVATPVPGGVELDFGIPRGATGDLDGVTPFWQARITADADAAAARVGLGVDDETLGVFSVKHFGAVGDGVTDDTAALQAALNAGAGGTVYVPKGVYKLTNALKIKSDTTLRLSPDSTIIRMADIDNMIRNDSAGTVGGYAANRNIVIDGGVWECNKASYSANCTPIAFGHCTNVHVKHATVKNVTGRWHAIEFNGCDTASVTNCTLSEGGNDEAAGEAIQLDLMSDSGGFPWFGPYDNTPCQNIRIERNDVLNWAVGVGSHTRVLGYRHQNIQIHNNNFLVSLRGVAMYEWQSVEITGNNIRGYVPVGATGGQQYGVYAEEPIQSLTYFVISNNRITGLNRNTASGDGRAIQFANSGITYDPAYYGIVITGNIVATTGRHGITVNHCSNVTITSNIVTGVPRTGIYSFGSKSVVITGNFVYANTATGYPSLIMNTGGGASSTGNLAVGNVVGNGVIQIVSPSAVNANNMTV